MLYLLCTLLSGKSTGIVVPIDLVSVDIQVRWENPYPAKESCKVRLVNDNRLETDTIITYNSGRVSTYKQVFYRAGTRHE